MMKFKGSNLKNQNNTKLNIWNIFLGDVIIISWYSSTLVLCVFFQTCFRIQIIREKELCFFHQQSLCMTSLHTQWQIMNLQVCCFMYFHSCMWQRVWVEVRNVYQRKVTYHIKPIKETKKRERNTWIKVGSKETCKKC